MHYLRTPLGKQIFKRWPMLMIEIKGSIFDRSGKVQLQLFNNKFIFRQWRKWRMPTTDFAVKVRSKQSRFKLWFLLSRNYAGFVLCYFQELIREWRL